MSFEITLKVDDAVIIGFRDKNYPTITLPTKGMPISVFEHALNLGLKSMPRDAAANGKDANERTQMATNKWAEMLKGNISTRTPITKESAIMKIALNLLVKALVKHGIDSDVIKGYNADAINQSDPVLSLANRVAVLRGYDDKATVAFVAKVKKTATTSYEDANREI